MDHKEDRKTKPEQIVEKLKKEGGRAQLVGRLKDGKIVIDQDSVNKLAAKYPNAEMSFIAVNAPFDPVPYSDD